jgi:damage-control phosphatase, subfamily I
MKTYLDCTICVLRQALDAVRNAQAEEEQQAAIMKKVLLMLAETPITHKPPEISELGQQILRIELNNPDPYAALKQISTEEALALLPWLQEIIQESPDSLETTLRLSAAGNIIDFGAAHEFDLHTTIQQVLTADFAIYDLQAIKQALANARTVLFLADNAGETVFDKLLIEQIHIPVFYAVKSSPVLNDATRADAISAGVDQVATIIETGNAIPGASLEICTPEFYRLFQTADLIISKGQGNYEMLSENSGPIFFLLKAKCALIARDLQVPLGSFILKKGNH